MISVIIPVYNREETICKAINSVIEQTYNDIEIIVVDDGSTDKSVERVKLFNDKRIRLVELRVNSGAAAARNAGIKVARGDYIAFLDSDDVWESQFILKHIAFMEKHNYKICFCSFLYHCNGTTIIIPNAVCKENIYRNGVREELRKGNFIGTPTILLHREVVDNVGLFDEKMKCLEDYEFFIRISNKYNIGFLDEVLLCAYMSKNSITKNDYNHIKAFEYLFDKYPGYLDISLILEYISRMSKSQPVIFGAEADTVLSIERFIDSYNYSQTEKDIIKDVLRKLVFLNFEKSRNFFYHLNYLRKNDFVIYGAGEVAKKVYLELAKYNIKPIRFVVSEYTCEKTIDGIRVDCVEDLKSKEIHVLVAVSNKYQLEILENLDRLGFMDYYIYEV